VPTEVSALSKVSSKVKVLTKVSSKVKRRCEPARPDPMPAAPTACLEPRRQQRPARPEPRRRAVDHGRVRTQNRAGRAR
jgi:hypothetical protein